MAGGVGPTATQLCQAMCLDSVLVLIVPTDSTATVRQAGELGTPMWCTAMAGVGRTAPPIYQALHRVNTPVPTGPTTATAITATLVGALDPAMPIRCTLTAGVKTAVTPLRQTTLQGSVLVPTVPTTPITGAVKLTQALPL